RAGATPRRRRRLLAATARAAPPAVPAQTGTSLCIAHGDQNLPCRSSIVPPAPWQRELGSSREVEQSLFSSAATADALRRDPFRAPRHPMPGTASQAPRYSSEGPWDAL